MRQRFISSLGMQISIFIYGMSSCTFEQLSDKQAKWHLTPFPAHDLNDRQHTQTYARPSQTITSPKEQVMTTFGTLSSEFKFIIVLDLTLETKLRRQIAYLWRKKTKQINSFLQAELCPLRCDNETKQVEKIFRPLLQLAKDNCK